MGDATVSNGRTLFVKTLAPVLVFVLWQPPSSLAQIVNVPTSFAARLINEPSGARNEDNGGNSNSGRLIGINGSGVDNFMIFNTDDLSAAAGLTVTGATVNVFVATLFSHPVHGSDADIINLNSLPVTNSGFVTGIPGSLNEITGSSNSTDDGTVSYANRVQYLTGGVNESLTMPWLDENGVGVSDLGAAMSVVATTPGYNEGSETNPITFDIDAVTAQGWLDSGLGGLVLSVTDNGDNAGRFNFAPNTEGTLLEINFIDPNAILPIDFNQDTAVDCLDVDALVNEITAGTNSAAFDLTGDGFVEGQDLTGWLADAGAANLASGNSYLAGDVDLDGAVNSVDLGQLLNNFSSTGGAVAYCGGDLDADSSVTSTDLGLQLNNFNRSASASVPEPSGYWQFAIVIILVLVGRRRFS